tara:strand:+ start:11731 stop:12648 length:918 start_codon:yes stop_codon:yes gene_type:complete
MKIYITKINESWIVDRMRKEWYLKNSTISTRFGFRSNVVWMIAPWTWKKIPSKLLEQKKVICTIHHIVPEKFQQLQIEEFKERDKYIDQYHTISNLSKEKLQEYTDKEIKVIPFWANQENWFYIKEKESLRNKFGFTKENFLIGSFQRDTEGIDLKSPKLEKGPDIFFKQVEKLYQSNKNLIVVLTGKRRQYLISKLKKNSIPYRYFEMVSIKELNELYNILNLYIVSSRTEGGPQAIVECGLTKTPIISTNVGYAPMFMSKESIYDEHTFFRSEPNVDFLYNNVKNLTIPKGMEEFKKMFLDVL